jgi:hypothetical protein
MPIRTMYNVNSALDVSKKYREIGIQTVRKGKRGDVRHAWVAVPLRYMLLSIVIQYLG